MDKILEDLIGNAEKLGTLSAGAIWAFFTLCLIGYIVYDQKSKKQSNELTLQMRIKDAESDILMSKAFEKLIEEVKEFRRAIRCIGGKE